MPARITAGFTSSKLAGAPGGQEPRVDRSTGLQVQMPAAVSRKQLGFVQGQHQEVACDLGIPLAGSISPLVFPMPGDTLQDAS